MHVRSSKTPGTALATTIFVDPLTSNPTLSRRDRTTLGSRVAALTGILILMRRDCTADERCRAEGLLRISDGFGISG